MRTAKQLFDEAQAMGHGSIQWALMAQQNSILERIAVALESRPVTVAQSVANDDLQGAPERKTGPAIPSFTGKPRR